MSSRIEGDALTAAQSAALDRYRARWAAIARSTGPADRAAAEEGVQLAYQAAGFDPPARFVWCDSPVAMSRRAQRIAKGDGPNIRWQMIDRMRRKTAAQVRRRLSRRLLLEVERAVNPEDGLIASVAEAVTEAATLEPVALLARYCRSEPLSLTSVILALRGRDGFRYAAAGPHDLAWLSAYEYLRSVLGLKAETEPLLGLWQVAANVGWLLPHAETCWLSGRPELMRTDAADRLHCASGPALRFADGFSVWAWRGVEVPRTIIEEPGEITPAAIDAQTNVQVRRCMIEIMTPQRYIAKGGARRFAEDETGVLWRKTWLASDAWAAVEVINGTPEADGTRKHYFLQVPANLRTAREAVAWTYGMEPEVYDKVVVRT